MFTSCEAHGDEMRMPETVPSHRDAHTQMFFKHSASGSLHHHATRRPACAPVYVTFLPHSKPGMFEGVNCEHGVLSELNAHLSNKNTAAQSRVLLVCVVLWCYVFLDQVAKYTTKATAAAACRC